MTVRRFGRIDRSRLAFEHMMARMLRSALLAGSLAALMGLVAAQAHAAQFADIAAGGRATCATTPGGQLYCWGDGREGQLGRIGAYTARTPVRVIGTYDSRQVTAGTDFACQLLERGAQVQTRGIYACWGDNSQGQIGNGRLDRAQFPQEIRTPGGITRVEAGSASVCALAGGGAAFCWGDNRVGQAGDGGAFPVLRSPQQVPGVANLVDLAVGDRHVCGVRSDGRLLCWGWSNDGQTGTALRPLIAPEEVPGLGDVVAVTAGSAHTCVLRRVGGGTVWCFGANQRGQLGTGRQELSVGEPQQVPGLTGITDLDAGLLSTCAIGAGGRVWCWGDGSQGKLGTGSRDDASTPVAVRDLVDAVQLSVGDNHVCALTSKGAPFCWGSNRFGQLGDGDRTGLTARALTPRLVRDTVLGRATFVPRALQSFPRGTSGGAVELRNLVVRKTSSRFSCPRSVRVTLTVGRRTAQRTASEVSRRSSTACRVSGTFPLPAGTTGATSVRYAVRGTHLRTAAATLRAQRTR